MPHEEIKYDYGKQDEYPDMRDADREIWEAYIEQNPDRFLHVWYDFRVGDPAECHPDTSPEARVAWADLTRWACDVIAEDADKIYIIELKPHANAKAIGQALSYMHLYMQDHRPPKPVVAVVLTDLRIGSTERAAAALGVEYWVV
jgi:hypothetical protein